MRIMHCLGWQSLVNNIDLHIFLENICSLIYKCMLNCTKININHRRVRQFWTQSTVVVCSDGASRLIACKEKVYIRKMMRNVCFSGAGQSWFIFLTF